MFECLLNGFCFIALESTLYSFGQGMPQGYLYLFIWRVPRDILYLKTVLDQNPGHRVEFSLGLVCNRIGLHFRNCITKQDIMLFWILILFFAFLFMCFCWLINFIVTN